MDCSKGSLLSFSSWTVAAARCDCAFFASARLSAICSFKLNFCFEGDSLPPSIVEGLDKGVGLAVLAVERGTRSREGVDNIFVGEEEEARYWFLREVEEDSFAIRDIGNMSFVSVLLRVFIVVRGENEGGGKSRLKARYRVLWQNL